MESRMAQRQAPLPVGNGSASLADILERVLDKGIVIAGDIQINLLDIELLTIKLRLLVASVDRAREMGIDWWESDPSRPARPARAGGGRCGSMTPTSRRSSPRRAPRRATTSGRS
jgi:hypothetical protein